MKTHKNISEAPRMGFNVDGEDSRGCPETGDKRKGESRLVIGSKEKRTLNLNGIKIPILPELIQESTFRTPQTILSASRTHCAQAENLRRLR